ncbi:MAG TPA: chorismate-binding protein [Bacteroidales bacterium]|nr:chorismate-binding protein [Bacteroidales bacterium]
MEIGEHIALLLSGRLPFAAYRFPDGNKVQLLTGQVKIFEPEKDKEGFVFHPYDRTQEPALLITPQEQLTYQTVVIPETAVEPNDDFYSADFEQYCAQVNRAVAAISRLEAQKLVLSRIIPAPGLDASSAADAFLALCQRFPNAFTYIFSDGNNRHWMGATPETLVSFDQQQAYTVALAGTLPANGDLQWTSKERKEQQIVTDYIVKVLSDSGAENIMAGEALEAPAGHVVHLKTEIRFDIPPQLSRFDIVEALHPTPAVCGNPRPAAMRLIKDIEKHQRAYYTGFLGPWSTNGPASLFVNLRCMRFSEQRSLLYVGGGITAESVAEREWAETTWKAATLTWLFDAK